MEAIELKTPLKEDELKKLLKKSRKKGVWEKLFGIAKDLPDFKEEDRMDARV
uniref:Uncharacterized protein n=1 Tax=Unknown prokaryotic organism TaxID=2725 RepID=A0A0F7YYS1_UNKP|nr:hypothetical protein [unidentified prokaryotic organism]